MADLLTLYQTLAQPQQEYARLQEARGYAAQQELAQREWEGVKLQDARQYQEQQHQQELAQRLAIAQQDKQNEYVKQGGMKLLDLLDKARSNPDYFKNLRDEITNNPAAMQVLGQTVPQGTLQALLSDESAESWALQQQQATQNELIKKRAEYAGTQTTAYVKLQKLKEQEEERKALLESDRRKQVEANKIGGEFTGLYGNLLGNLYNPSDPTLSTPESYLKKVNGLSDNSTPAGRAGLISPGESFIGKAVEKYRLGKVNQQLSSEDEEALKNYEASVLERLQRVRRLPDNAQGLPVFSIAEPKKQEDGSVQWERSLLEGTKDQAGNVVFPKAIERALQVLEQSRVAPGPSPYYFSAKQFLYNVLQSPGKAMPMVEEPSAATKATKALKQAKNRTTIGISL